MDTICTLHGFFFIYILFYLKNFLKNIIYFWLCWVFIAISGLSLVAANGSYSSFVAVSGLLIAVASLVEHGL